MRTIIFLVSLFCCSNVSAQKARLVHIPRSEARLIEKHLRRITELGWAEVTPGDLYHGHILLSTNVHDVTRFRSLKKLFSHKVLLLYHSDEQLRRWRLDDGDLPTAKKRPRSIIGFPDGSICPASLLLTNPVVTAVHYEWFGSIHSDDLVPENPKIDMRRDREVVISNKVYSVNLIFDIGLAHGREPFITVGKDRLKVTVDCK